MAPVRLPNALIYLSALLRPRLLRPDLRVPSIAHLDFQALRRKGYNAVVIDKDNCLTRPDEDELYPPLKTAWTDLLSAFSPGRVLIVSNSAGTKKDPGGIAAEAVSLSLQCPVLLHSTPKPGCTPLILSYFAGHLPPPHTLRNDIIQRGKVLAEVEKGDEDEVLEKWRGEVEHGLLLGPGPEGGGEGGGRGEDGKRDGLSGARLEGRMVDRQAKTRPDPTKDDTDNGESGAEKGEKGEKVVEELRLVVIGDRLFTDTLLAHRLSLHLRDKSRPKQEDVPRVISIHTTSLPEPRDVRVLRWIEERLSGGKLKDGKMDWSTCVRRPPVLELDIQEKQEEKAWWWQRAGRAIRESKLEWDPRTWRPLALGVGAGRGIRWMGRGIGRGVKWVWARARRRGAKLETEIEGSKGSIA